MKIVFSHFLPFPKTGYEQHAYYKFKQDTWKMFDVNAPTKIINVKYGKS